MQQTNSQAYGRQAPQQVPQQPQLQAHQYTQADYQNYYYAAQYGQAGYVHPQMMQHYGGQHYAAGAYPQHAQAMQQVWQQQQQA